MTILIVLIISVTIALPVTHIIIQLHDAKDRKLIFGDKLEYNQDDNPLLLTVKAMEAELAELHENNIHMERIAQLEKDIEEAKAHAEALSKVAGNYGSTMEEAGEQMSTVAGSDFMVGGIGGNSKIISIEPPHESVVEKTNKENKQREQEELRQLLMEASKEFTKATYGQWNVIPRDGLSHEERAEKFIDRWVKNETN